MYLSAGFLGKTATDLLAARARDAVLVVGKDHLTRGDLARVSCFNFLAAARLTAAIAKLDVRVTSLRDLFDTVAPSALAVPDVGAISLAVLGAAFEAKGIGGAAPLEAWVAQHRPEGASQALVTFSTLKAAEAKREAGERRGRRRRRATAAARRGRAHELRVDRFLTRRQAPH